jgi:hypothetical protein
MFEVGHSYYEHLQGSGNALLVKDDVGRAKPSTRALPGPGFTYGKDVVHDAEDAGQVTSSWKFHQPSQDLSPDRDFKTLNRLSVRNGKVTARDQTDFRKVTDARIRNSTGKLMVKSLAVPMQPFGMPSKPSTPMAGVIGGLYGRVASEMKHEEYNRGNTGPKPIGRPRLTKAATQMMTSIRSSRTFVQPKRSEFKMKKFLSATARVDTLRKPQAAN